MGEERGNGAHTPAPSGCLLPLVGWHRLLTWCGYTQGYRAVKVELKAARSTLSPAEIVAMSPLMRGPTYRFPVEAKLAKWTQ